MTSSSRVEEFFTVRSKAITFVDSAVLVIWISNMPTYALLGATGATGSAVLRYLLSQPPNALKLNVFVRSRVKLLKAFPNFEETSAFSVTIFEGTSTDTSTLQRCLDGVDIVFMCIASNESHPSTSIMYDTTAAIIDSLKDLRQSQGSQYHAPTILQMRSASLNQELSKQLPWIARWVAGFCFYFNYADHERATNLYETIAKESPSLCGYIFVDAPSLHDSLGAERTGYKLVTTEKQNPELSYADLGAAFCELAERYAEFSGTGVGVSATGHVKRTWGVLQLYMASGFKNRVLNLIGII